MMRILRNLSLFSICFNILTSAAVAQSPVISAEQVQDLLLARSKALIIDVRSMEEYREGHIPGSINIPAELISSSRGRLPKDKNKTIIFYCRGAG